jgi:hypothetical protein
VPDFTYRAINRDSLPHEYIDEDFKITEIQYGPATLNWDNFDLKIVDHPYNKYFGLVQEKHKRIRLEVPLVNSWDLNFHMKTKSWGPFSGLQSDVDLYLRDLYLTLEGVLTIDSEGKPVIDPSLIDLGL